MGSRDFYAFEDVFKHGCKNPNAFTDDDVEAYKFAFSQPGTILFTCALQIGV